MKKQKKQNLLTAIIIILVIALAMLVGSMVYEEMINISKQESKQPDPTTENENDVILENEENPVEADKPVEEPSEEEEFVGEEEQKEETEDSTKSKDEKAIDLAKKKWGHDDAVIFSIVDKNGSKYRVAVTSQIAGVGWWYEVDTETWQISEF